MLENIIVIVLFFGVPPLLYVSAIWLLVQLMGWQLAMTAGAGILISAYREPIARALPQIPERTEHHRLLRISRFATPAKIEQAYRRAIQHQHPDRGGTDIGAVKLNEARTQLLGRRSHD